jgi:hypothetical protein
LFINNVVAHLNAVLLVLDSIGTDDARAAVARNEQELKPHSQFAKYGHAE